MFTLKPILLNQLIIIIVNTYNAMFCSKSTKCELQVTIPLNRHFITL